LITVGGHAILVVMGIGFLIWSTDTWRMKNITGFCLPEPVHVFHVDAGVETILS
jgi:hypothetical protein